MFKVNIRLYDQIVDPTFELRLNQAIILKLGLNIH